MWLDIRAKSYPTLYPKFLNLFIKTLSYVANWPTILVLTLFRMGFFGATHGCGGQKGPLPKTCHTYPTIMKLGTVIPLPKKVREIYESRDTPLEFCWHQHFFTGNQQILLYQEIQIKIAFWYTISIYFYFFWVFIDCYNKRG